MARDMASLMSQPMAASPPGEDAEQQQRGLQGLMQQQPAQAGPPQPNYQQTVAALRHMAAFRRHWQQIMQTPNFGKADVKGPVIDMLADLMGDGYVTLPQTLKLLQDLPTNPLQQRQWVEQHYANDVKASAAILQHFAISPQQTDPASEAMSAMAQARSSRMNGHVEMMNGLRGHYEARAKRRK